jgi:hypothetical protein
VNLSASRLRLIFVADVILPELRRIVEFLNEQLSRTEVLALEVRQYVEQGGTRVTLVPRLIGETQAALQAKGSSGRARNRWTEADVLAAIRKRYPPDVAERLVELYEFMRERGARQSFGTGATPSVTMWLGERPDPATSNPVAVAFYADGFAVPFNYIRGKRSEAELKRLADLVRQIPGAAPDVDRFEEKDFRALGYLEAEVVLASDDALAAFKQAIVEASKPPAPAATS